MDGKHAETTLRRNSRLLQFLMKQIHDLVSSGQPVSEELTELAKMCADTVFNQIDHMGV